MHRKAVSQNIFMWTIGGSLYYSIEYIFRGFSHWSMFVLGGICFLYIFMQGKETSWQEPLWIQVIRCTIFVVASEFITGIIVNKWLGWNVWDYSEQPFHLLGQICLPFAVFFSGLCALAILLSANLFHWLYGEKKPIFHIV